MKGDQLSLPVLLQQAPRFENFFNGPNADVVAALKSVAASADLPAAWIFGAKASGKSHLLSATVHLYGGDAQLIASESLNLLAENPDPFERCALLAIDDVDAGLQDQDICLALMRLIDRRRSANLPLVLAASAPPDRLQEVLLPDLLSRFRGMALMGLKPLRHGDRLDLLELHARARGLELGDQARNWLLAHLRRDAGSLISALEQLDRAALIAQRRPTLPFIKETLATSAV